MPPVSPVQMSRGHGESGAHSGQVPTFPDRKSVLRHSERLEPCAKDVLCGRVSSSFSMHHSVITNTYHLREHISGA